MIHKLSVSDASKVMSLAKRSRNQTNIRLGHAIMNELPQSLYESVSGTELDMFYFEDDLVAENFFWNNFV